MTQFLIVSVAWDNWWHKMVTLWTWLCFGFTLTMVVLKGFSTIIIFWFEELIFSSFICPLDRCIVYIAMAFVQEIAFTNVILSCGLLKFHDVSPSSQTSLPPLECKLFWHFVVLHLFYMLFSISYKTVYKSDYWWKFFNSSRMSYFHLWANVYPAVLINFNFSSLLFLFSWFLNILINVKG